MKLVTHQNYYTVLEAVEHMRLNGVKMGEVALRIQIVRGTVKSTKIFNSRVIPVNEISRLIRERKGR